MKNLSEYINEHIYEKLVINKDLKNPYLDDMRKLFNSNVLSDVSYNKIDDVYLFEIDKTHFEDIINFLFDAGEEVQGLLSVEESITYLKNTGDYIVILMANADTPTEPFAILIYNSERYSLLLRGDVVSLTSNIKEKTYSKIKVGTLGELVTTVLRINFDFVKTLDIILKDNL